MNRLKLNKWICVFVGAVVATIIWGIGLNVLFLLKAPNEMGPPLFVPVLLTYLTALLGASITIGLVKSYKD
jgi:hypothetical protein